MPIRVCVPACYVCRALGGSRHRSNPIGEDRKRMGFVIVADVSSENSFKVAFAIGKLLNGSCSKGLRPS